MTADGETYLKHVSVIVVGGFAGAVALFSPDPQLASNALLILAGIMGYVMKNGHAAASKK